MKEKLHCLMLIDDDEPTNFLSSIIIEEANCATHLVIVDSGEKALGHLLNSQKSGYYHNDFPWPDLVFLDINMPAMNGWEFLERYNLQFVEAEHKIIIVMLTTSLNPDDKIKALTIPAVSGFEIKPLTADLLKTVINKYFSYDHKLM